MRRRQDDTTRTSMTAVTVSQGQQGSNLENPAYRTTHRRLRSLYYMAPPLLLFSSGVILIPEIHTELVSNIGYSMCVLEKVCYCQSVRCNFNMRNSHYYPTLKFIRNEICMILHYFDVCTLYRDYCNKL